MTAANDGCKRALEAAASNSSTRTAAGPVSAAEALTEWEAIFSSALGAVRRAGVPPEQGLNGSNAIRCTAATGPAPGRSAMRWKRCRG